MDGVQTHAALGHHVSGYGGINAARQEQKSLTVGADRQAARPLELTRVDVCAVLTHLDTDGDLGIVNIDTHPRTAGKDHAADLARDLGRTESKCLIGALGLDLKGLFIAQEVGNILTGDRLDALHALLRHRGSADSDNAEHLAGGFKHALKIGRLVLGLDEHRALGAVDLKMAMAGGADAQLLGKLILKGAAIGTLEHDLTVFTKQNFLDTHWFSLIGNRCGADSRGNGIVIIIREEALPDIAAGEGVSHGGMRHAGPIDLQASHRVSQAGMLHIGAVGMRVADKLIGTAAHLAVKLLALLLGVIYVFDMAVVGRNAVGDDVIRSGKDLLDLGDQLHILRLTQHH